MSRRRQPEAGQLALDVEVRGGQQTTLTVPPAQLHALAPSLVARLDAHGWRYLGTEWNRWFKDWNHKLQGPMHRHPIWGDTCIKKVDQGVLALLAVLEGKE